MGDYIPCLFGIQALYSIRHSLKHSKNEKKHFSIDSKKKQDCSYQGEVVNVPTAF